MLCVISGSKSKKNNYVQCWVVEQSYFIDLFKLKNVVNGWKTKTGLSSAHPLLQRYVEQFGSHNLLDPCPQMKGRICSINHFDHLKNTFWHSWHVTNVFWWKINKKKICRELQIFKYNNLFLLLTVCFCRK